MTHYLITGSSSGIGAALATQLTTNGHEVSGIARRKQRLTALSGKLSSFNGYAADVSDAESLATAIDKAKAKSGAIFSTTEAPEMISFRNSAFSPAALVVPGKTL